MLIPGGHASAQQAVTGTTPDRWITIAGQYAISESELADDGVIDLGPEDGFAVTLEAGLKLDEAWSTAMRVSYGRASEDRALIPVIGGSFAFTYEEDRALIDLEIGRELGRDGQVAARISGGVRIARFAGKFSGVGVDVAGVPLIAAEIEDRFTGAGPWIGFDLAVPVTDRMRFQASAAGGALIGRRKSQGVFVGPVFPPSGVLSSETLLVPHVEASAKVKYLVTPNLNVNVGYRLQQFWGVLFDFEGTNPDRLIHGPFFELTVQNW